MRIALMWPDYWPYIRRGTERMVHDIAVFLVGQNHAVDIITTKPGNPRVTQADGIRIIYQRQLNHPLLVKLRMVPRFDFYGLSCLQPLLAQHYDLIHLMFFSAGPTLRFVPQLRGTPYIYHVQMIPPHFNRHGDEQLLRLTLRGAAEIRSLSQYCNEELHARYGHVGTVVPPSVDIELFRPAPKPRPQRLLFTADLKAPNKGAGLLAQAFNTVYQHRPDVVLQYAGPTHPAVDAAILDLIAPPARGNVAMLGPGTLETVRQLYAEASVVVLPSQGEPFGMVLTEALASGAAVVGSRSGGIPEIISSPDVGALFDLDPADPFGSAKRLADAILRALALTEDQATPERCRTHASQWGWPALGPRFLALQESALHGGSAVARMPRAWNAN